MKDKKKMSLKRRGPMGGGPGGAAIPGEKAKDFFGTLNKTVRYMRKDLAVIVIAFILAVFSVIATLFVPDILGGATDELLAGTMSKTFYKNATEIRNGIPEFTDEQLEMIEQFPDLTVRDVADMGMLPEGAEIDESMMDLKLSALVEAKNATTVGELFRALGATKALDSLAVTYRARVENTSLTAAPKINTDVIVSILTKIIALVCVSSILAYVQGLLLAGVAQRVSYRFRRDINNKIDSLPLKFYDTTTNGEVMSYITNDVDAISNSLNQSLSQIVTSVTTIIGVMVMMFTINWILTLITLLIVPISMFIVMMIIKRSQRYYLMQQEYLGHVNGHIEEMFAGHNVISLFNGEEKSIEKFSDYNSKLYESAWSSQFFSGMMMPVMKFVGNLNYVLACVLGGVFVLNGNVAGIQMTVGNIQSYIQYVRQFNQPINQISGIANTFQSTVAAAERIFNFLEQPEEQETGDAVPENVEGNVTFDHVRFGYNEDKIIIKDFSCDVKKGQRIAIVGPTGAGKTTVVKLLMRFYELNGGDIYLDGTNIRSFTREGLRNEVGMVLQDTWLFSGTIMENIRYGRLSATDEEVKRAAKIACADHFIQTLPGGYDFEINTEADNISQGQKQLLTIARAILADPTVLILDEATSSVDTRTEILIQQAMDRLMQGRTSFIIAHRLSTIRDADKILVLRDGDVIEQGKHEELLAKGGFYATLYNSQFEG